MRISTVGAVFLAAFFVAGCGGGGGGETNRTDATFAVEGRVLNGVLAGSTVQALGAGDGSALGTATTDNEGRYIIEVPQKGPYRLRATGGQLNAVEYSGTLEAFCPVGSDCFVTPYTTVLLRLVDDHGFNHGDATALMASSLGFDGDPFAGNVPVVDFDLDAARAAIAGGDGLAEWVASIVAWATSEDAEPPPGVSGSGPVEPPAPPVDPDPVPPPAPDPDPEPIVPFTHAVSATAGTGGSISPTSQTIEQGTTATFDVTPDAGYSVDSVSGCNGTLDGRSYTTGAITEACSVSATFALVQYTLTYAAGPNGSLTGSTSQTVSYGQDGTVVVAKPDAGYQFVQWSDGNASDARTDNNVTDNLNVTASFEAATYTVSFNANGGLALTPASIEVTHGQPYGPLATTTRVGHNFQGWFTAPSGGPEVTSGSTVTITASQTLYAQWSDSEYTVSQGTITGGSLSPASQTVAHGDPATFTLSADDGYDIDNANLSGCGGSLAGTTFTTGAITGVCTITGSLDLMVYTLTYAAGPNGSLDGETVQAVSHGASGTAVTAIPATGYSFVAWSDSSTANPRADSNVTGDIGATANFTLDEAPVGPTAVGSCGTTPQDMQYTNTLTATDTDPSSYPTFTLLDGSLGPLITPKGGEVIITDTTTGDFVYTPGLIRGLDTFQFKVTDTAGYASTAIETVVVDQAVMPLGDSITEGYISESENPPNSLRVGYREELQKMLKASGITFDFVGTVSHGWDVPNFDFNHQGHGGWTAAQIAWGRTGFPQDGVRAWLDRNPSDFILLHIGTNGLDPSNSIDVAAILDEIDLWKTNALTEDVQVIVALIIDRYPNDFRVSLFNDNVKKVVEERIAEGATMALVDHQNALIYPDDLADQLHPNEMGYKKMAAVWFEKLAPMMDRCP